MSHIPIVHIYGKLGEPDFWDQNGRSYLTPAIGDNIRKCVEAVKIFSERGDDSPECQKARELLESAQRICFLGFAYDQTNLKRILPSRIQGRIYGTAYGLKEAEINQAKELLRKPLGAAGGEHYPPDLHPLSVLDALRELPVLLD